MLPYNQLLLYFFITTVGVNGFNSCHLQQNCKQKNILCDNESHLCFCQTNDRISQNGVCLHSSHVNTGCLVYQPCLKAKCITANGIDVNFTDSLRKNIVFQSLRELVLKKQNKLLAFCRCDSPGAGDCNYKVIGRQCSEHRHCSQIVANSECRNGICTCNQTHYHLDDTCLQKKNFDQICSDNNECVSNLLCRNSLCKCRRNYELDAERRVCLLRSSADSNEITSTLSENLWNGIAKVSGFVFIVVLMLFLCTKKDSELQNQSAIGRTYRRRSAGRQHQRTSSVNSHRPLTQTSSNASRSSAYRTFEEPVPIRQTIIMPSPTHLIRSLSSSSDDVDYNPYQFDKLFPQQTVVDDPPSYEEVVNGVDKD